MPDPFELLASDHEQVRTMLDQLQRSAPTALTTESEMNLRKAAVDRLIIAESQHEAVEEMYFWPAVASLVPEGRVMADRGREQEDQAKQVLQMLDKTQPREVTFEKLVMQVIPPALEHISYEEEVVWPQLRSKLSAEAAADLGEKLAKAKKLAPTRPHAQTPSNPTVLKTAGVVSAVADRIRDTIAGRGD
ncbi:MAG: hemerythrin domain-containing protein [Actinomycetota bacterium]|nr:hemerythrin domain-containing protein [Actinomycetota bacterium]